MKARARNWTLNFETLFSDFREFLNRSGLSTGTDDSHSQYCLNQYSVLGCGAWTSWQLLQWSPTSGMTPPATVTWVSWTPKMATVAIVISADGVVAWELFTTATPAQASTILDAATATWTNNGGGIHLNTHSAALGSTSSTAFAVPTAPMAWTANNSFFFNNCIYGENTLLPDLDDNCPRTNLVIPRSRVGINNHFATDVRIKSWYVRACVAEQLLIPVVDRGIPDSIPGR